jgi:Amt family ammonium transporter
LLLGVFASKAANPNGVDGLLAGSVAQLGYQAMGVLVVTVYAFIVSWVILKVIHSTMGLRVTEESEIRGLDFTEHSEAAYS